MVQSPSQVQGEEHKKISILFVLCTCLALALHLPSACLLLPVKGKKVLPVLQANLDLPFRLLWSTNFSCLVLFFLGTKAHVSLKIKGHRFFFLMDKDGDFLQPTLFDRTVGLKRF